MFPLEQCSKRHQKYALQIFNKIGVVKVVGYFICVHDDSVEQETEADKNKKMLKDLLSSKSGRDLMKESMALSEKEKSNHNTVTSAENNV